MVEPSIGLLVLRAYACLQFRRIVHICQTEIPGLGNNRPHPSVRLAVWEQTRLSEYKLHDCNRLEFSPLAVANSRKRAFVPFRWASMAGLCHKERHNFGQIVLPVTSFAWRLEYKGFARFESHGKRITPPGLEQSYGSRGAVSNRTAQAVHNVCNADYTLRR